jgi:hypothetical protein
MLHDSQSLNEQMLVGPVSRFFSSIGYMPFEEVPVGQKRVDLLMVHRNYPKFIAVELKVKDWRRALQQAIFNQFVGHLSYVALWHTFVSRVDRAAFEKYGIGLLRVDSENGHEEIKPRRQVQGVTQSMWNALGFIDETRCQEALLWR